MSASEISDDRQSKTTPPVVPGATLVKSSEAFKNSLTVTMPHASAVIEHAEPDTGFASV